MMVRCPICSERLFGEGENDLSFNLQEHMSSVHGFEDLCNLEVTEGGVARAGACKETPSGELANLSYDERRIVEAHRPEGVVFPGEDIMQSVRCPVCGEIVLGHASDDLSRNLAKHMDSVHEVKVDWQGKG